MSRHSRRDVLRTGLQASAFAAMGGLTSLANAQRRQQRPPLNVLFIAVDDLRPVLGCYGDRTVRTPNIDALAAEGLTFTRAYCQQAVCSPSRTSLLTGLRPDTTRVYDLYTHFRRYLPAVRTLPQHFKNHRYATASFSKIFHNPQLDDPASWSEPPWMADSHPWRSEQSRHLTEQNWNKVREAGWLSSDALEYEPELRQRLAGGQTNWGSPSWESRRVADSELPDGKTADAVIAALGELKGGPFFVAAGFLRPHLPFVAPEKYYDLYPEGDIELDRHPEPPQDGPLFALHNSGELRQYSDIPQAGPIDDKKARELIRGYRASVSYVDAQIGRVLQSLTNLGLRDNTVVVLWGDHG